jgi:hypothetical protein
MTCPAKTAITDSELGQTFGSSTVHGLLPSSPNGASDRESNGMLKKSVVQQIISSLKGSGVIPSPGKGETDIFAKKQADLLKNIQDEYCFYDARYKYALEKLLEGVQTGYVNNTPDTQSTVQKYLKYTQVLNQRINDLIQIINGVTDDMLSTNSNLESEIKAFDKKINDEQKKLAAQNDIISSNQAVTKLNKELVKYTEQKGKYTNNLLGLYSFLNIVALGLLIYVYKSAP